MRELGRGDRKGREGKRRVERTVEEKEEVYFFQCTHTCIALSPYAYPVHWPKGCPDSW
jgi:hypothetical protein